MTLLTYTLAVNQKQLKCNYKPLDLFCGALQGCCIFQGYHGNRPCRLSGWYLHKSLHPQSVKYEKHQQTLTANRIPSYVMYPVLCSVTQNHTWKTSWLFHGENVSHHKSIQWKVQWILRGPLTEINELYVIVRPPTIWRTYFSASWGPESWTRLAMSCKDNVKNVCQPQEQIYCCFCFKVLYFDSQNNYCTTFNKRIQCGQYITIYSNLQSIKNYLLNRLWQ